jgi:hypothetical protein
VLQHELAEVTQETIHTVAAQDVQPRPALPGSRYLYLTIGVAACLHQASQLLLLPQQQLKLVLVSQIQQLLHIGSWGSNKVGLQLLPNILDRILLQLQWEVRYQIMNSACS